MHGMNNIEFVLFDLVLAVKKLWNNSMFYEQTWMWSPILTPKR